MKVKDICESKKSTGSDSGFKSIYNSISEFDDNYGRAYNDVNDINMMVDDKSGQYDTLLVKKYRKELNAAIKDVLSDFEGIGKKMNFIATRMNGLENACIAAEEELEATRDRMFGKDR